MHSSAAAIGTGAKNTGDNTSAGSMTVGAAAPSTPVPAGTGVFTINSQLPSSILPGEHTITLYGTGPNGQLSKTLYITVSSTLRVTYMSFTQSESASLAATGTDPVLPLILAALALLAGGAAIISRRVYHS